MKSSASPYAASGGLIFCQEILPEHFARGVGRVFSQVFPTPPNPDPFLSNIFSRVIEMILIKI
jgi:hypothetical protein